MEGNFPTWFSVGHLQAHDDDGDGSDLSFGLKITGNVKFYMLILTFVFCCVALSNVRVEEASGQVLVQGLFDWSHNVISYEIDVLVRIFRDKCGVYGTQASVGHRRGIPKFCQSCTIHLRHQ
jgi:hypothetical protein